MSKNIVISGNTFNGVSVIKAQNAGEGGGTSSFVDLSELEQTKTQALNMASGNQVITPDTNKVLTQVTITKPDTLVAGNIKKDVVIGGVTGTFEGVDEQSVYQHINETAYGTVSTISFTVNSPAHLLTYQADDGMTWSQWILSDYNTDGYIDDGDYIYTSGYSMTLYLNQNVVLPSDLIIANAAYYFSGGGEN